MLIFLYLFGKKENGTWGKILPSNIIDPTDLVAAIEGFNNNIKEETESAIDGIVDERNDDWKIFFEFVCDVSCKICLKWGWRKLSYIPRFPTAALHPICYASFGILTPMALELIEIHLSVYIIFNYKVLCNWNNDNWLQSVTESFSMKFNGIGMMFAYSFICLDWLQALIKARWNT